MRFAHRILAVMAISLALVAGGCSSGSEKHEHQHSESHGEHHGEHDRDGHEHAREGQGEHGGRGEGHEGEEGEESGTEFGLDETYDQTRRGARLILAYDAASNSFHGTVENTTGAQLERVRVEVHLSNGKELGPTTPADLAPGQKIEVKLSATSRDFDRWTAHPEVGSGEHGHEGEERGR